MRCPRPVLGALIGLLPLSACGDAVASAPGAPSSASARNVQVSATFSETGGEAVTYDRSVVNAGARVAVTSSSAGGATSVVMAVRGLVPGRTYGAHAHTEPCGAAGADAGPRFQNAVDPVQPSVDARFTNPENEIWLDLTTDATGAGSARAMVPWAFPPERRARSVVIHAIPAAGGATGPEEARAACVRVDF